MYNTIEEHLMQQLVKIWMIAVVACATLSATVMAQDEAYIDLHSPSVDEVLQAGAAAQVYFTCKGVETALIEYRDVEAKEWTLLAEVEPFYWQDKPGSGSYAPWNVPQTKSGKIELRVIDADESKPAPPAASRVFKVSAPVSVVEIAHAHLTFGDAYPNPIAAGGMLTLRIIARDAHNVVIETVDLSGVAVASQHVQLHSGVNSIRTATTGLSAGAYLLRIRAGADEVVRRFIVQP